MKKTSVTFRLTNRPYKTSLAFAEREHIIHKGTERTIRYLPNERSVFVDEQNTPEDKKGENIRFEGQEFTLDVKQLRNTPIIEFLRHTKHNVENAGEYGSNVGFLIEEVKHEKNAEDNLKVAKEKVQLSKTVLTADDEAINRLAIKLNWASTSNINDLSTSVLRDRIYTEVVAGDYKKIDSVINDDIEAYVDFVIDCLEEGLLIAETQSRSIIREQNDKLFVRNDQNQDALRLAAMRFKTENAIYDAYKVRLASKRNTGSEYTPPEKFSLASAEATLVENNLTSWEDIKNLLKIDIDGDNKATYRHGNLYKLRGSEIELTAVDKEGKKAIGKNGAKLALDMYQSELEEACKIAVATYLQ